MTRFQTALAGGVLAATCLAGAASAQQAGTYSGNAKDGSGINFTIATDTATGNLQVSSALIFFTDTCNPGKFTFSSGWGLGSDGTDLSGNEGTYNAIAFGYFQGLATLKFSGDKLTGTIQNVAVNFEPTASGTGTPKKAAFCKSKKQTFTATLQPASTAPQVAGHGPSAVVMGGTIVRN